MPALQLYKQEWFGAKFQPKFQFLKVLPFSQNFFLSERRRAKRMSRDELNAHVQTWEAFFDDGVSCWD